MRVLIIGGTGLISTAITRMLIARGDDVTLYNRGQTDADIPEGYDTIRAAEWCKKNFQYNNIFDNTAARADLNFRYTIPFVEGVRRITAWLDARDRIHDRDEPAIYSEIIERWKNFSTKETFFNSSDNTET